MGASEDEKDWMIIIGIIGSIIAASLFLGSNSKDDGDDAPTAQCNDGTYSYSDSRQGTCSHHGGVLIWITDPDEQPARQPNEDYGCTTKFGPEAC